MNKKEHKGCDSPDPDSSYALTPRTEEKYKKINEEFDIMIKSHKIPVSTQGYMAGLLTTADVTPP